MRAERTVHQLAELMASHWADQMVVRWERELAVRKVGSKVESMVEKSAV